MAVDSKNVPSTAGSVEKLDVLVVGAGFSGLYQLHRLRQLGFKVKAFEAAPALGGVWYWNCYPGARCDSEGAIYQFSAKELWADWNFEELYPSWDQLRAYFQHVDRKLDLSRDIRFNTRVKQATFDNASDQWIVEAEDGHRAQAQFLVLCTGIGSKPQFPEIEGLHRFGGELYHTGQWPQDGVDLAGKRIGVLGTGASGVQVVQEAAPVASHLTVFQRTPNLALPMRQRKLSVAENEKLKERYAESFALRRQRFGGYDYDFQDYGGASSAGLTREQVYAFYETLWEKGGFFLWLGNFADIWTDERSNRVAYEFWRDKVRQRIKDPYVAETLAPTEPPHPFGVKRISLEQNYYDVFNQPNVHLVDLKQAPIKRVTEIGVLTADGKEHALDMLVLATGFDMVSGGLTAIDIRGPSGQSLKEKWRSGISAYMGSMTSGYPNLLFVYGPHAPAGLSNGPSSSEIQGDEIVELLQFLRDQGIRRIESSEQADAMWRSRVDTYAATTLFGRADSWYMGGNVPGKVRQMMNYPMGIPDYLEQWKLLKNRGYQGFVLSRGDTAPPMSKAPAVTA